MAIMAPAQAKDMAALPDAIMKFERDFKMYEKRTGEVYPN